MTAVDPDWTAPRDGQDWQDHDLMVAVVWLKSLVPSADMERRLDAAKAFLANAKQQMREGNIVPLYDPADTIAWYILQAQTFATDRAFWTPEGVARAVPYLTRIGKELQLLLTIPHVEDRASRMMLAERQQPDGTLFELLVALAYRRGGWTTVEFVPEARGRARTQDLIVSKPRSRWAVECKRMTPSIYAAAEQVQGAELAGPVHQLALEKYQSIRIFVKYKIEISDIPLNYLLMKTEQYFSNQRNLKWNDEISIGIISPIDWGLARKILKNDYVYFGGSRMIEILSGSYMHHADHSLSARWRPWEDRPDYADAVYHASIVSWISGSRAAEKKKARHFHRIVAGAETQLPSDIPGIIHVGIESRIGADDFTRHFMNSMYARDFRLTTSKLRWIYGNYFVPEMTTRQNESWAFTETMVPYRVGRHRSKWPLPGHYLVIPNNEGREGVHWDGHGYG